jgi:hypothetical protein
MNIMIDFISKENHQPTRSRKTTTTTQEFIALQEQAEQCLSIYASAPTTSK